LSFFLGRLPLRKNDWKETVSPKVGGESKAGWKGGRNRMPVMPGGRGRKGNVVAISEKGRRKKTAEIRPLI